MHLWNMCRGVVAWRRWLTQKAGGGPEYAAGGAVGDPYRNSLGKLQRRELLDRYSQHTQHCATCSQVPSPQQESTSINSCCTCSYYTCTYGCLMLFCT